MDIEPFYDTIFRLDGYFLNDIYHFLEDYFIDNDSIIFKEPLIVQSDISEFTITGLEQERSFIYAIINGQRYQISRFSYQILFKIYQTVKNKNYEN